VAEFDLLQLVDTPNQWLVCSGCCLWMVRVQAKGPLRGTVIPPALVIRIERRVLTALPTIDSHKNISREQLNRLHGPPKKSKFLRHEGLKGLLPYIRAVCAVGAAAHDGYSRLGFPPPGCTQGTGGSSECSQPGLTFIPATKRLLGDSTCPGLSGACTRYCGHRTCATRLAPRHRPILHHLDWCSRTLSGQSWSPDSVLGAP